MLFDVGRVCEKTTGREKGKKCVIVNVIDQNFVLVDGETKRKRVNVSHLKPLDQVVKIKKGAKTEEVKAALK
ncbi:MAG: 50S ribosomal protein L14e [Candidatus Diapherotrites archaeon]|nr:50S ribosomal protein L14e [Candidatus Diapherotrites archaeon]